MNIMDILFWIFFVLSIAVVVWIIVGKSPTIEQALLVMILTVIWSVSNRQVKLETKFNFLAKDFKEHCKHKK